MGMENTSRATVQKKEDFNIPTPANDTVFQTPEHRRAGRDQLEVVLGRLHLEAMSPEQRRALAGHLEQFEKKKEGAAARVESTIAVAADKADTRINDADMLKAAREQGLGARFLRLGIRWNARTERKRNAATMREVLALQKEYGRKIAESARQHAVFEDDTTGAERGREERLTNNIAEMERKLAELRAQLMDSQRERAERENTALDQSRQAKQEATNLNIAARAKRTAIEQNSPYANMLRQLQVAA